MSIKQISAFIENKSGMRYALTGVLWWSGVDMRGLYPVQGQRPVLHLWGRLGVVRLFEGIVLPRGSVSGHYALLYRVLRVHSERRR